MNKTHKVPALGSFQPLVRKTDNKERTYNTMSDIVSAIIKLKQAKGDRDCAVLDRMDRESFSEEQRYEVEEQAMQSSGSITPWAAEPEVQSPCGQVCLELLSYSKRPRGWNLMNKQERRSVGPERSPGTRSQRAWPDQAFSFYSKLVGNHWKVLSGVFYLFIFASMCHPKAAIRKGK